MQLEQQLKQHRGEQGLTQEALAQKLNVSRSTISNWENGRSQPDLESLLSLSDLFEIPVDRLLRGDQKMTEKINRDIKKGRQLKKILSVSLAPLVIVIIALSWFLYSKGSLAHVALAELESVTVPSEPALTAASQLEGVAQLGKYESIEFATFTEFEDTLYLEVYKRKKLTNLKNDFSIGLENIYQPERIKKIVLIDRDSYSGEGPTRGISGEELQDTTNKKILWEKKE